ncbi:MAG: C10 family peptidase [bacterium]
MRSSFVLLSILVAVFTAGLQAELATERDMELVCRNWLEFMVNDAGNWGGSHTPRVASAVEIRAEGLLLARAFQIDPGGFIVVPVLKELPPVKAFSTEGKFVLDEQLGIGALLRQVLADRLRKFTFLVGDLSAPQSVTQPLFDSSNRVAWEQLLQPAFRAPRAQAGPLLSTTWHQTAPYNSYCPWGDGNRSVVWCVATALAQIINYHEWPPAGFGHTEYLWNGDQSCGDTSPGLLLYANFSDRYFYNGTTHDIAELSMEVGKSYHVDYGVCYSVGDTMPTYRLLPDYFAYQDSVRDNFRSDFTASEWFATIQEEIDSNRPIDYLIFNHMIVCDGWMTVGEQMYYHMNYGWGGGSTTWYALDQLYCGWAGCDPMLEHMYTHIAPDRQIMFYADTLAGEAPLTLQFTGSSDLIVDNWQWTFGDGSSSAEQNPQHTYQNPGLYGVTLRLESGAITRERTRADYLYVLADSITATASRLEPGGQFAVDVSATNLMPLTRILLPVTYAGDLELTYDSCSVLGCRTEQFQSVTESDLDPASRRLCLDLQAWLSGYSQKPYLDSGSGVIARLYFTVDSGALPGQLATIGFDGYDGYEVRFDGTIHGFAHSYRPAAADLSVDIGFVCGDANADLIVNVTDAVYLISYVFNSGPAPTPYEAGDANEDDIVNITDAVYLVQWIFNSGPVPCATNL